MTLPTALLVSHYRAFAGLETLPLRPLTLLYGKNNSGKSALVRALAMLGASLGLDEGAPPALPPGLVRDGEFADLAWRGEAGDYSFEIGLCWDDDALHSARFTLDGGPGRAPYVKELVLTERGGHVAWNGISPPGRPMRPFGAASGKGVPFAGLVPLAANQPILDLLAKRMLALRDRVYWLESVRGGPKREIARTGSAPRSLATSGSNAAEILVERADLLSDVRRFYASLDPPRDLEVKETLGTKVSVTLSPSGRASFRIHMVDTGEGMIQVFPVLVAAAMASQHGAPCILAVEEPESHLHPDAQVILAKHLCSIASGNAPPTLVLETHSRAFLLGVQLAVAEGLLPAGRVGLVWVDQDASGRSSVVPTELDDTGHPREGWPMTALADDLRLSAKLAKIDLARGR